MYLYFNNEGKATTKIPHGEIIRQGNNINLYICFPLNFFDKNGLVQENFSVGIKFKLPDLDGTITAELPMDFQGIKKFYKLKDSEITYDLIDGKNYLVYYRNITGVTDFYGNANGIVVFNELDENNTIINSTYPETFNFFIEKTVGYGNKSSNINLNQYKLLQNAISVVSKELERLKLLNTVFSVSYLPDVVYDAKNEKYNLHEFINKLYILNGNFIDVDTLPTEAIQINQVYKCENKYYRIKIINDEEYEFVEIIDFETTIGRIYKILEDGNWICINRDIREVIGRETDETDQTLFGLKNNLIKYVDDNFPKYITEPNMVYGTNSEGNTVPIPHDELKPNIILRYQHFNFFPTVGEMGKFYISEYDSVMYYWDGIKYQRISNGEEDFDIIDGGDASEYEYDSDIIDGGEA